MRRGLAATFLVLVLALPPQAAGAQTGGDELTFEQVHTRLTDAGFQLGPASVWMWDALSFRASGNMDGAETSLWVFVFPTTAAARATYDTARTQDGLRLNHPMVDSDDRGPQLLSGFSASAWWRNVAVVQQAEPGDRAAWPAEPDCGLVPIRSWAGAELVPSTVGMPRTVVSRQFMAVLESADS